MERVLSIERFINIAIAFKIFNYGMSG